MKPVRRFRMGLAAVAWFAAAAVPAPTAPATSAGAPAREYRLRMRHLHTNERIEVVYRRGDAYLAHAVRRLEVFLRDHRTGDTRPMDPRLLDLLTALTEKLGQPGAVIEVICGYRTPASNEFLRRTTTGVASQSLHVQGEAIDLRIPGVTTARLRDAALSLRRGGVGYYPESGFVHVDVGRVRRW